MKNPLAVMRSVVLVVLAAGAWLGAVGEALSQCDPGTPCYVLDENGRQRIMRYSYFLPDEYNAVNEYPLVIWLHGAGHRGLNGNHLNAAQFSAMRNQTQSQFPAVFLAPQLGSGGWSTTNDVDKTLEIVTDLIGELSIDPNRVYLTGTSMGGFGTTTYLQEMWSYEQLGLLADDTPRFAAAAPLMGSYLNANDAELIASLQDLPMWLAHGDDDPTVSPDTSRDTFRTLAGILEDEPIPFDPLLIMAGGPTAVVGKTRYTEVPGGRHNITDEVYADDRFLEWMFAQSLVVPEPGGLAIAGLLLGVMLVGPRKPA